MIRPRNLLPGDTICVVGPSRKIAAGQTEVAKAVFEQWGLNVVFGAHTFADEHSYLASTDAHRVADLNDAIRDNRVNAIIAARGGYGITRIVDKIDFSALKDQPKWMIGFSDITALHLAMFSRDLISVHGMMPLLFGEPDAEVSIESLKQLLFAGHHQYHLNSNPSNRPGVTDGRLIGGNLSLIVESLGTKTEIETDNCILVIEEIDEYKYKVDRMLHQLKRAGKLSNLAGLIVGHMTQINDSSLAFGESVEEIICNATDEYRYPVAFDFPCGHAQPNLAFMHGALYSLSVESSGSTVTSRSIVL